MIGLSLLWRLGCFDGIQPAAGLASSSPLCYSDPRLVVVPIYHRDFVGQNKVGASTIVVVDCPDTGSLGTHDCWRRKE